MSGHVLMNSVTGINTSTVLLTSLDVETPYRRAHAFRANTDDVNVLGKAYTEALQMCEEESVGQTKRLAGLYMLENLFVILRHRGVGDEQQGDVAWFVSRDDRTRKRPS